MPREAQRFRGGERRDPEPHRIAAGFDDEEIRQERTEGTRPPLQALEDRLLFEALLRTITALDRLHPADAPP